MAERSTYDNAKHWIAKIRDDLNRPGLPGVLVACKSDLKEFADVPTKEASDYAKSIGLEYFECSAVRTTVVSRRWSNARRAARGQERRSAVPVHCKRV